MQLKRKLDLKNIGIDKGKARKIPKTKIALFPSHPFNIQPLGQSLLTENGLSPHYIRRKNGLGFFAVLSDEMILNLLSHYFAPKTISCLAMSSSIFYLFCYDDSLWRNFTIGSFGGSFVFQNNWRNTWFHEQSKRRNSQYIPISSIPRRFPYYSDYMYQVEMNYLYHSIH